MMEWLIVFCFCFRWVGLASGFFFFRLLLVILLIKIHVDGPFSDHAVTTEKKPKRKRESREKGKKKRGKVIPPAIHHESAGMLELIHSLLRTNERRNGERLCAIPSPVALQTRPFRF
jgi:hypothetical protein